MKIRHYMTKELEPELHADIYIGKRSAVLVVWINYGGKVEGMPTRAFFNHKFRSEAEAVGVLKGFGHGYEYLGARWVEVGPRGELTEV